jgi:hypothetical protein
MSKDPVHDDLEMAALLGEPPPHRPDSGFRYDVFARITGRARRRAAFRRAATYTTVFAALGLAFPAVRAVGLTVADIQPLLMVAGALGLAYVLALTTIEGPRALLARSRAVLRMPI